jgi:hypothetical protein
MTAGSTASHQILGWNGQLAEVECIEGGDLRGSTLFRRTCGLAADDGEAGANGLSGVCGYIPNKQSGHKFGLMNLRCDSPSAS